MITRCLKNIRTEIIENILKDVKPIDRFLDRIRYIKRKEECFEFQEKEFHKKIKKIELFKEFSELTNFKIESLKDLNDRLNDKDLYKTLLNDKKERQSDFITPKELKREIDLYEKTQHQKDEETTQQKNKIRFINRLAIEAICENAPRTKIIETIQEEPLGDEKSLVEHIINNKDRNLKIIISGESGIGKTWFLAKLFLSLYENIDTNYVLPMHAKLSDVQNKLDDESLKKLLRWDEIYEKTNKRYTPIILLDGFNEISSNQIDNLKVTLKFFEDLCPNICWIITTQPQTIKTSWLKNCTLKSNYEFYKIKEITEELLDELVKNNLAAKDEDISKRDLDELRNFIKGLDVYIKRNPYYISCICNLYIEDGNSTENISRNNFDIIDLVLEKKWKSDFKDLSPQMIKNLKLIMGVIGLYELLSINQRLTDNKSIEWLEKFEDAHILPKNSKNILDRYLQKKGQWKDIFVFDHDRTRDYAVAYLIKFLLIDWKYTNKEFREWLLLGCLLKENLLEPISMAADIISLKKLYGEINIQLKNALIPYFLRYLQNRPYLTFKLIDKIDDDEIINKVVDNFYKEDIIHSKGDVFIGMASILKNRSHLLSEFVKKRTDLELIKTYLILFFINPKEKKYFLAKALRGYPNLLYFMFLEPVMIEIVQRDEDVKEAVIDMLERKSKYVKERSVRLLSGVIHSDKSAKAKVLSLIDDENQFVRQAVISSIKGAIGQGDIEALDTLIKALQTDEDNHVRLEAIKCLGSIIKTNNTAKRELIKLLNDENYKVKAEAVNVLAKLINNDKKIKKAIIEKLSDNDYYVRLQAVKCVSSIIERNNTAKRELIKLLNDENYKVKAEAVNVLAKLINNDKKIKKAIIEKLSDNDYIVKISAIEAMSPFLRKEKILEERVIDLLISAWFDGERSVVFSLIHSLIENNYNEDELREIINRKGLDEHKEDIKAIIEYFDANLKKSHNFGNEIRLDEKKARQQEDFSTHSGEDIIIKAIKDNFDEDNFLAVISNCHSFNKLDLIHYKQLSDLKHIGNHNDKRDFISYLYDKHFPIVDNMKKSRSQFFHINEKAPIFFNYCTFALSKYFENNDQEKTMVDNKKMFNIKYIFERHFLYNVGFPIKKIENGLGQCIFKIFSPENNKESAQSISQEIILAHWDTYWTHLKNIIDNATKHKIYRCYVVISKLKTNKEPIVAVIDDGEGFPSNDSQIAGLFKIGKTHREGGTGQGLTEDMIRELDEMGFKVYLKHRAKKWNLIGFNPKSNEIYLKHNISLFQDSYQFKNNHFTKILTKSLFNKFLKKYGLSLCKDGNIAEYMNKLLERDDLFKRVSKKRELSCFSKSLYEEYFKNSDIISLKKLNRAILEETFGFLKERDISLSVERKIYKYSNKKGGVLIIGK